jgi:hypothetical protein
MLSVARYIVLNPVRARMVSRAIDWPWSSWAATAGLAPVRSWLTVTTLLDRFDPFDRDHARAEYGRFVQDVVAGAKRPWDDLVGQLYLSSKAFIARVQERIEEQPRSAEHPVVQRFPCRATLDEVRESVVSIFRCDPARSGSRGARMAYALLARSEALARLAEIGAALGIGTTGASYLIGRAEGEVRKNERFATMVEEASFAIRNCRLQM